MQADRPRRQSIVDEIRAAYGDLRGSFARQRAAEPDERQLLFYVFLACTISFVTGLPGAAEQVAALDDPEAATGVYVGRLFAALFVAPLVLYGLAALSRVAVRPFGGAASWRDMRLALFWALVVAIPLMVVDGLKIAILAPVQDTASISTLISAAVAAGFAWIWANFIAEANGFRQRSLVFVAILTIFALCAGILALT